MRAAHLLPKALHHQQLRPAGDCAKRVARQLPLNCNSMRGAVRGFAQEVIGFAFAERLGRFALFLEK
jgi:hypothetical protein